MRAPGGHNGGLVGNVDNDNVDNGDDAFSV